MDWTGAGACPSADGWMGRHRGWIGKWSGCRSGKAREQETNFANAIEENPLILQTPSRKHFFGDRGERNVKQNRLHRQTWGRSPCRRCTHRRLRVHRERGDHLHRVHRDSLRVGGSSFLPPSPHSLCTHRRLRVHRRQGELPHVCRCSLFWVGCHLHGVQRHNALYLTRCARETC